MTRILTPTRTTDGSLGHRCPLNNERITPESCEACPHFVQVEPLVNRYRLHCDAPSTGVELIEFTPMKALDERGGLKGLDLMKSRKHTWYEPKLDGARALVHCTEDGVFITTRRKNKEGKYSQFQDNVPHLRDSEGLIALGKTGYTILDGEVMLDADSDTLASTMSIVSASPEHAAEVTARQGKVKLNLFDVIWSAGSTTANMKLSQRKAVLQDIASTFFIDEEYVRLIPETILETEAEREAFYQEMLDKGYEGAIAKNPESSYFESGSWLKLKERTTVDALVTSWEYGSKGGKYANTVGALKVSIYSSEDNLREIAKVVPGDDAKRNQLFNQLKDLSDQEIQELGMVVEIEAQGFTKEYRLRHPRILRYRPDRNEPNLVDLEMVKTL